MEMPVHTGTVGVMDKEDRRGRADKAEVPPGGSAPASSAPHGSRKTRQNRAELSIMGNLVPFSAIAYFWWSRRERKK